MLCVVKKKAGSMSHFLRPTKRLVLSHFGRELSSFQTHFTTGELRWTSGKWSQTYILSISGSLNAVLEQTNSKLPGKTGSRPGHSSGFPPASPRSVRKILGFSLTVKYPLELDLTEQQSSCVSPLAVLDDSACVFLTISLANPTLAALTCVIARPGIETICEVIAMRD